MGMQHEALVASRLRPSPRARDSEGRRKTHRPGHGTGAGLATRVRAVLAVAFLAVVGGMAVCPQMAQAAKWPPASVKVYHTWAGYHGSIERWQLEGYAANADGSGYHVQCFDPQRGGLDYAASCKVQSLATFVGKAKAKEMRALIYFSPGGPGYDRNDSIWKGIPDNCIPETLYLPDATRHYFTRYRFLHYSLGYMVHGGWYQINEPSRTIFNRELPGILKVVTQREIPTAFVVNAIHPGGNNQRYAIWANNWKNLVIKKTLAGNEKDAKYAKNQKFKITVTLKNGKKDVNGIVGGYQFTKGKRVFELKGGESVTIKHVPPGYSWKVTEEALPEFVTSYKNATGTMTAKKNETVTVTNNASCGSVKVSKAVVGRDDGQKDTTSFAFTLTVTNTKMKNVKFEGRASRKFDKNGNLKFTKNLKDGQSWTVDHLPIGSTYRVTEATNANYDVTVPEAAAGTIAKAKTYSAKFTNTPKGSLTVKKKLLPNGTTNPTFNFKLTVTKDGKGLNGTYGGVKFTNGVTSFSLHKNETKTFTQLPRGAAYSVDETVPNGYKVTWENKAGKIKGASTVNAMATNTETGKTGLSISKQVVSAEVDAERQFDFTLTLRDAKGALVNQTVGGKQFVNGVYSFKLRHDEDVTIEPIPAGYAYQVAEAQVSGYVTEIQNASGKVQNNQIKAVTVTNIDSKGSISVTKKTVGITGNRSFRFTLALQDSLGEAMNATFPGRITTPVADPATVAIGDEDDEDDSGSVSDENERAVQCAFVDGTYSFDLKANETMTISEIPSEATYELTEEPKDGIETTIDHPTGTIERSTCTAVTVTNAADVVPLTIKKQVTTSSAYQDVLADHDQQFTFRVELEYEGEPVTDVFDGVQFRNGVSEDIKLRGGEEKTIRNLPTGCTYRVVEVDPGDDWEATVISGADTGMFAKDTPVTVTFRNDLKPHSLSVTKNVVDNVSTQTNPDDVPIKNYIRTIRDTFGFSVTLTYHQMPINMEFSGKIDDQDHTFSFNEDGVCTFELKDGQTATIDGLPQGCDYSVMEDPYDGYETTTDGEMGTLTSDAHAVFTNKVRTGRFKLTKKPADLTDSATADDGQGN